MHVKSLPAFLAFLVVAAPASAQNKPNPNLNPTFGAVTLASGFGNEFAKDLVAGGQLSVNIGGVRAHVAKAPDFRLNYTKGDAPLVIRASSVGDTTLLVNLPDGTWVADDDSGGGLDPLLRFPNPQSGRYDIYVGTFQKDNIAATLRISEGEAAKKQPRLPFNPNLPECWIVSAGVDNYPSQNKLNGCLNDARNTVAAFRNQTGMTFRDVKEKILLDGSATHNNILASFQGLTKAGAAGDTMVLFLSGHGARTNGNRGNTWFFLPYDYHPKSFTSTALTDVQILQVCDQLVAQKKNVVVIVDACYCGYLAVSAQPYLQRYQNMNQGGLILMLSSAADQTSTALGSYSAYAKAFADTMAGAGDLNRDTKITLGEIQAYSNQRTHELLVSSRSGSKQDSIVTWSPSFTKDAVLGHAGKNVVVAAAKPLPAERPVRWVGNENLPGFGKLAFNMYSNGRVVMEDAKSTSDGSWRREDNHYTLTFSNGAVVYTGTLNGNVLAGDATSPRTRQEGVRSWNWSVQQQN